MCSSDLIVMTDKRMERATSTMVKRMYFPSSGITIEVAGVLSIKSNWKRLSDSKIEVESDIFSCDSAGR